MSFNHNPDQDDVINEINLTPLIDIMLVLLIIFMVTSSVSLESGLDIDLPQTASQTISKEGSAVIISVNASGDIFVQGQKTPFQNLKRTVEEALKTEATGFVILEGHRHSTLEKAIQIMDIAKKAGAQKFAIAAAKVAVAK